MTAAAVARTAGAIAVLLLSAACAHRPSAPAAPAWLRRAEPEARARTPASWWTVSGRPWTLRAAAPGEGSGFDLERAELFVATPTVTAPLGGARAIVRALALAADARHGWSRRETWRRQDVWRGWLELRFAPTAHAAARGLAARGGDAADDLALLMARLLVPDPDRGRVACRLITHAEQLRRVLAETEPEFVAAAADRLDPPCPEFERWARLDRLDGAELIWVAPTGSQAASWFGHLVLRLRARDEAGRPRPSADRSLSFFADTTGELRDDPLHPIAGIFGLFDARLVSQRFDDLRHDYTALEGRDLARWSLVLDAAGRRRLMARAWTLRSARFSYYFFAQNCATLLLDLIAFAFDAAAPPARGLFGTEPSAVLAALEAARRPDGRPWIEPLWPRLQAYSTEALEGLEARSLALRRLGPVLDPRLAEALERLDDPTAARRVEAYRAVAERAPPSVADAILGPSVAIESDRTQQAILAAHAERWPDRRAAIDARVRGLLPRAPPEVEGVLAALGARDLDHRDEAWRVLAEWLATRPVDAADATAARRAALLSLVRGGESLLERDPALFFAVFGVDPRRTTYEQDFAAPDLDLLDPPAPPGVATPLRAVLEGRREARRRATGPAVVAADPGATDLARVEAERAAWRRGDRWTGVDRLELGGGVLGRDGGVWLAGAVYETRLGDDRRFGFPRDAALTVGRGAALWTVVEARPVVLASELRLFGYRGVRAGIEPPGLLRRLGGELYGDIRTWGHGPARLSESVLGGGPLLPLHGLDDRAEHVLVGLAADAWMAASEPEGARLGLRLPARLELRLAPPPDRYAGHGLRVAALAGPRVDLLRGTWDLWWAVEAELRATLAPDAEVPLRGRSGVALFGRARAERDPSGALRAGLSLGLALE